MDINRQRIEKIKVIKKQIDKICCFGRRPALLYSPLMREELKEERRSDKLTKITKKEEKETMK